MVDIQISSDIYTWPHYCVDAVNCNTRYWRSHLHIDFCVSSASAFELHHFVVHTFYLFFVFGSLWCSDAEVHEHRMNKRLRSLCKLCWYTDWPALWRQRNFSSNYFSKSENIYFLYETKKARKQASETIVLNSEPETAQHHGDCHGHGWCCYVARGWFAISLQSMQRAIRWQLPQIHNV